MHSSQTKLIKSKQKKRNNRNANKLPSPFLTCYIFNMSVCMYINSNRDTIFVFIFDVKLIAAAFCHH